MLVYGPNVLKSNKQLYHVIYRQEAGVDLEGTFVQRLVYDDSVSYDLVAAAEKVLGELNVIYSIGHTFLLLSARTAM